MRPGPIRLFLLEHRRLLQSLIEIALCHEQSIQLAGCASCVDEARALLDRLDAPIDVAIVDLSLPGDAAIAFLPELHAQWPACSRHASFDETLAMIRRAGKGAALIEPNDLNELLRAAARFRAVEESARAKFDRLTAREMDVLRALARGCSDKEIAAELQIKNKTVATHVASVLDKLVVSSRLQAVLLALQFDVVELGFE